MSNETEKLLERAEHLIDIDRPKEAIPLITRALASDPQDYRASCLMSIAHLNIGDPTASASYAERAIESFPDDEWGHRLRSVALAKLGRKQEALESALEANRLAPDDPGVMNTLVEAYLAKDKPNEAKATAERMREIAPEMELSHFTLGNVYLHTGDNWNAAECFRKALSINPLSSMARNNLGVAMLRGEDKGYKPLFDASRLSIKDTSHDTSIEQFTEAINLDPGNTLFGHNLRVSHDYLFPFYVVPILFPFAALALFVEPPAWAFMFVIMNIVGVIQQLWLVRRKRRELSQELRTFIGSSRKSLRVRWSEFVDLAANIFKTTWPPHLLLLAAIVVCHAPVADVSVPGVRTWNQAVAYVMVIISFIWFIARLRG